MAYVGQFENLVREKDRGRAIRDTRTISVFSDGLVVRPVPVYARSSRSLLAGLLGAGRSPRPAVTVDPASTASADEFAALWPKARLIPFERIDQVVLSRPRQVSELAIFEEAAEPGQSERTAYLGDLSADRVRELLAPLLGDRLTVEVQGDGGGEG